MERIRNFSIIAHIDHGKSTLADRLLEYTHTIEKRAMREQVLDRMDLERERGITIKMKPVRMEWKDHIINLIDTPGHVDFSYEVSRALSAVEGVVLLVDATQGVQAQTLSVLSSAKDLGLVIIPVLSKVDSAHARIDEVKSEVALLLNCAEEEIILTSGKTGEGVEMLLEAIINRIPPPRKSEEGVRGLIFDFAYSDHRGVIVYTRVFDGEMKKGDKLMFTASREQFTALEIGVMAPGERLTHAINAGEIGYIVTGIKKPGVTGYLGECISGKPR
jgi:GTP-binding protein LepA